MRSADARCLVASWVVVALCLTATGSAAGRPAAAHSFELGALPSDAGRKHRGILLWIHGTSRLTPSPSFVSRLVHPTHSRLRLSWEDLAQGAPLSSPSEIQRFPHPVTRMTHFCLTCHFRGPSLAIEVQRRRHPHSTHMSVFAGMQDARDPHRASGKPHRPSRPKTPHQTAILPGWRHPRARAFGYCLGSLPGDFRLSRHRRPANHAGRPPGGSP
jgi:hypothetical protein